MRTPLFVCLLCGVWISPVQAFGTDSDDLQTTFHVEPAIADFSLSGTSEANIQQWLNRYLVKPQIQYIHPQNSTLSTKEALVFGLSTEFSF